MNKQKLIAKQKQRRKFSVRNRVRGDAERPRMSVFRSCGHVACQVIDDTSGRTLVSASTRDKELRYRGRHRPSPGPAHPSSTAPST